MKSRKQSEVGQDQGDRAQPEVAANQSRVSISKANIRKVPTHKIGNNA